MSCFSISWKPKWNSVSQMYYGISVTIFELGGYTNLEYLITINFHILSENGGCFAGIIPMVWFKYVFNHSNRGAYYMQHISINFVVEPKNTVLGNSYNRKFWHSMLSFLDSLNLIVQGVIIVLVNNKNHCSSVFEKYVIC